MSILFSWRNLCVCLIIIPGLMRGKKVDHLSCLPQVSFLVDHSLAPMSCMPKRVKILNNLIHSSSIKLEAGGGG